MASAFINNAVYPWIKDNKWPQTETPDDYLVISVPAAASADANGLVLWNSAVAGYFEVETVWDHALERLNQTSVYLEVPGFGAVVLFSGKNIDLKNSKPISVSLPGTSVDGTVQFVYGSKDKNDIKLNWKLTVPWFGSLDDGRSLFPTESLSANNLQVDNSGMLPYDQYLIHDSPEDAVQQRVAASFIHDNVVAGNPVVTVQGFFGPKSETITLDINFLGVFQLAGTYLSKDTSISAIFYFNIPFNGRLRLAEINGVLTEGIEISIDLALAKGSVKVSAKAKTSGRHDLYIDLDLAVKFLKEFHTGEMKLFELPF